MITNHHLTVTIRANSAIANAHHKASLRGSAAHMMTNHTGTQAQATQIARIV